MTDRSYLANADAWQTKVHNFLLLPFPFPWLLIAVLLFGLCYLVVRIFEPRDATVELLALQSILVAAIGNAVVFYERLLDEVADVFPKLVVGSTAAADRLVKKCYHTTFWSARNVWVGLVLALLLTGISLHTTLQEYLSIPVIVCSSLMCFIIGFLGGSMLWTMLGISRLMLSLGRDIELRLSIFDSATSPLRTASSIMWKVSLISVLVYLLGLSIYYILAIEIHPINLLMNAGFGLFLVLYFIIPQINIHKALVRIKEDRLSKLVAQIDFAFDQVTKDPTTDNIGRLKELFELQRVVNGKRAWSFGINQLMTLIGSIIVPLVIFALGYYLSQ